LVALAPVRVRPTCGSDFAPKCLFVAAIAAARRKRIGGGEVALMPFGKAPGAGFEIAIDGKPRSYRDRRAVAIEAAEYLKWKHPHSEVVVTDLPSGKVTAAVYSRRRRRAKRPDVP
jgi:hypothetical protein